MLAGRSLPHAVMMMIPEAYQDRDDLPEDLLGLLRLPLVPDGAVGRPRRGRLHRRPRDRRDAGPQRPAPRPLAGDRGRLGRPGLGVRRDGRGARERQAQGPPAARQALPRRPRARRDRRRRRGQARGRGASSRTRSGSRRASSTSPTCRRRRRSRSAEGAAARAPARVRLHPGGPARPARADRGQGRGADRLDGQRRRARGAQRPASRRCSATSSSSSRRSRTRRSTRSARRS